MPFMCRRSCAFLYSWEECALACGNSLMWVWIEVPPSLMDRVRDACSGMALMQCISMSTYSLRLCWGCNGARQMVFQHIGGMTAQLTLLPIPIHHMHKSMHRCIDRGHSATPINTAHSPSTPYGTWAVQPKPMHPQVSIVEHSTYITPHHTTRVGQHLLVHPRSIHHMPACRHAHKQSQQRTMSEHPCSFSSISTSPGAVSQPRTCST
jgi:hypothetical protein